MSTPQDKIAADVTGAVATHCNMTGAEYLRLLPVVTAVLAEHMGPGPELKADDAPTRRPAKKKAKKPSKRKPDADPGDDV